MEQDRLEKLGLITHDKLKKIASGRRRYLVDELLLAPSINILAGDSGLGKSALAAQLGMCIATGKDFFGHKITEPGTVIYCDAESTPDMMLEMQEQLADFVGVDKPPEDFIFWNPNWNVDNKTIVVSHNKVQLYNIVKAMKPKLVILDSLRNFYPLAIKEQEHAATMIKEMRKYGGETDTSFLMIHHLRKKNKEERASGQRATVKNDVLLWLEEAAGSLALINNTDTRLGWERDVAFDEYYLGGFLRVYGALGPYKISRELDEEGDPMGYRMCTPVEQLPQQDQVTYEQIPAETEFTFKFLVDQLKKGKSASSRFIRRAMRLKLIRLVKEVPREDGNKGRPTKVYMKIEKEQED